VPLLPIVLEGTANALPKRGFVLQGRHPISVRVLDAVPCPSAEDTTADVLASIMRERFLRELREPAAIGTVESVSLSR
jgi:hypothetical protein